MCRSCCGSEAGTKTSKIAKKYPDGIEDSKFFVALIVFVSATVWQQWAKSW
jgi:hypothetical protein